MKQTSVEWLVEELNKYKEEPWKYVNKGGKEAIIEKANAMHKEEILDACKASIKSCGMNHIFIELPNEYYNETFKSE